MPVFFVPVSASIFEKISKDIRNISQDFSYIDVARFKSHK